MQIPIPAAHSLSILLWLMLSMGVRESIHLSRLYFSQN